MGSFLVLIIFLGMIYFIFKIFQSYFDMPKLNEYLKEHPKCNTGNGIKCINCGSKSIRNWGKFGPNSSFRVHICNHCGLHLYRS
jgi:hypothetical protein